MGMAPNCTVCGIDFVGDILFVGTSGEEFCDLPVEFKEFKQIFSHLWEV